MKNLRRTIRRILIEKKKDDPCWDDYEMVGTKKKGGKEVPNCVPMGDEADEGNAFSGARQDAIDNDEDEFEVGGETFKVKGKKEKTNEAMLRRLIRQELLEAIYDGRKVELNKPMSNPENPKKKSKVYVNSGEKYKSGKHKGQVRAKKVQFGDPNMRIKKSNPEARKSFRARHKCDQNKPKDSAGYWSCKAW